MSRFSFSSVTLAFRLMKMVDLMRARLFWLSFSFSCSRFLNLNAPQRCRQKRKEKKESGGLTGFFQREETDRLNPVNESRATAASECKFSSTLAAIPITVNRPPPRKNSVPGVLFMFSNSYTNQVHNSCPLCSSVTVGVQKI